MDLSAANLHLLECDHWLSQSKNVLVVRLSSSPWQDAPFQAEPAEQMERWTVDELVRFLTEYDLEGPARILFANGVRGQDLKLLTATVLSADLGLSSFAATRILNAREAFLCM